MFEKFRLSKRYFTVEDIEGIFKCNESAALQIICDIKEYVGKVKSKTKTKVLVSDYLSWIWQYNPAELREKYSKIDEHN